MAEWQSNLITMEPRPRPQEDESTVESVSTDSFAHRPELKSQAQQIQLHWSEILWAGLFALFLINVAYLLWPQGAITLNVRPHPQTLAALPVLINTHDENYALLAPATENSPAQVVSHIRGSHHAYSAKKTFNGVLKINTASASELQQLPGIGPKMAQRIVAYRKQHGAFQSISDLQNVEGIGPKKFAKIASHCRI